MNKRMLLPKSLVCDLLLLLIYLQDYDIDTRCRTLCDSIGAQIKEKFNSMEKHDIFTMYKTASTDSAERNEYRKRYLDLAEIHNDWRSEDEIPF